MNNTNLDKILKEVSHNYKLGKIEKIKMLRELTDCSIANGKNAIEYAATHFNCTAYGYLRAIIGDTSKLSVKDFNKRVKRFSDLNNDIF